MLCKFSKLFGEPKKNIHNIRIFDIAIIDVIFTILGSILIQFIIKKFFNINIHFLLYLFSLFLLGIIIHRIFCVNTTINKIIFGSI